MFHAGTTLADTAVETENLIRVPLIVVRPIAEKAIPTQREMEKHQKLHSCLITTNFVGARPAPARASGRPRGRKRRRKHDDRPLSVLKWKRVVVESLLIVFG